MIVLEKYVVLQHNFKVTRLKVKRAYNSVQDII